MRSFVYGYFINSGVCHLLHNFDWIGLSLYYTPAQRKFHVHVECDMGRNLIDFQQRHFSNDRLVAIFFFRFPDYVFS